MTEPDVLVIGAGLAGLACGKWLAACGKTFQLLEASDGIGGRVRTDVLDGFRLDRGFQIYLTAYPEGRRVLDYESLDLRPFSRGALVRYRGRFRRLADPRERPLAGAASLFNRIGSPADKVRVARMALAVRRGRMEDQLAKPESLTLDMLRSWGVSDGMIGRLFRPFFGGVFLDHELKTTSRLFRFLFRTFSDGQAAVPAAGMQSIPGQLATGLPAGSLRLNAPVERLGTREAVLASGEVVRGRMVVVAVDGAAAARLLGGEVQSPEWNGSTTLYYAAAGSPVKEPVIVLDGDGRGPVNSVAVMSDVAPGYAPAGQSLISASVVGVPPGDDAALDRASREQLTGWFGTVVGSWRLLRVYRIPHSLPEQSPGVLDPWERPVRLRPGLYVCGDHRDNGSIDGALTSGFRAAQAVMEDLAADRA